MLGRAWFQVLGMSPHQQNTLTDRQKPHPCGGDIPGLRTVGNKAVSTWGRHGNAGEGDGAA